MTSIPTHKLQAKNLKRQGFDIIPLKSDLNQDYEGVVPHRHNFFELLLFTEGGGKHEIDFKEYPIEKNSVHFVSPEQVHRLKSAAANGFVFCFTEEFMSLEGKTNFLEMYPFYDFDTYAPLIKLPKDVFHDIEHSIKILIADFSKNSFLHDDITRCYFQIILLKIKEFFLSGSVPESNWVTSTHPKIIEFKKLVNVNFINQYSAFQYAEDLNISPNYLNSICKKETGKTAIQLIHERLLLEAKRLLYSTNLSVKEIAFSLNFEDVAYFNRFFKKNMSATPLEYRQQFTNS
ncbi:MAG: transcriptional regulator, AraC family [Bacteroidetes bacterium]|jgi:AraC-like DNA-binding protein|nr:transcriptional regulator, AraC family [Bacteroidota bacterium]